MFKLIRNIIIIALISLAIAIVIGNIFSTFGWGDNTFYTKSKYFLDHPEDFNGVYVGGSLEYRHIDPFVIDAIAKDKGIDLRSFNLGNDGYNLPLQVWVTENLLKKNQGNIKYIFLSLSSDPLFYKGILHTKEWNYWQNIRSTIFSIRVLYQMNISNKLKTQFSRFYITSLVENMLKVEMMDDLIQFHVQPIYADSIYLGHHKNGYFPYDDEEKYLSLRKDLPDEIVSKMKNNELSKLDYQKNQAKRDSLELLWSNQFATYVPGTPPIPLYLSTYLDLHKKCEEQGIKLIFIMPPKGRTDYQLLSAIYEHLPENSKINLADPRVFPEFFTLENGYNYHHMNSKGSEIYSKKLGMQISNLLSE
ncbi:MAG: hypothetical protein LC105_08760 [Chitinophagales bacterium]|nr:hypothetical protein [Chitinophagales bacterium]MCZ2393931.1 hypothetical protein [Chitinophagales bacterium]